MSDNVFEDNRNTACLNLQYIPSSCAARPTPAGRSHGRSHWMCTFLLATSGCMNNNPAPPRRTALTTLKKMSLQSAVWNCNRAIRKKHLQIGSKFLSNGLFQLSIDCQDYGANRHPYGSTGFLIICLYQVIWYAVAKKYHWLWHHVCAVFGRCCKPFINCAMECEISCKHISRCTQRLCG